LYIFKENIEVKEYEKFVENHPKSHFLQSGMWEKISVYRGYLTHRVGLYKDNKLIVTALILEKKLPFKLSYFYIPRGFITDYSNKEFVSIFTNYLKKFAKKRNAFFFKIDPDIVINKNNEHIKESDNIVNVLKKIGYKRRKLTYYFETNQPRFTFRLNLNDNYEDRFNKTIKQNINKAKEKNIEVIQGKINNVDDFYKLMRDTEKRKDFYSHNENYYKFFFKTFGDKTSLLLTKVNIDSYKTACHNKIKELNEKVVSLDMKQKKSTQQKKEYEAKMKKLEKEVETYKNYKGEHITNAAFTVFYGDKAWALYGGRDDNFSSLRATALLYEARINSAVLNNKSVFDLFGTIGKPSSNPSINGIHEFKSQFGGDFLEFIGEFDYICNPILYYLYLTITPIRSKLINFKLRKFGSKKV
jgi:peptidoglycan pentaglycine glycine transferase (the first glycine)